MSTELNVDIAALVGEMEDIPCEHSGHGTQASHSDEPASHYARFLCGKCGYSRFYAACPRFVRFASGNGRVNCKGCRRVSLAFESITILGPIGATK